MKNNNRGAYLAVQEVLFFLFGLVLFIAIIGVFSEVREITTDFSTEIQFESIAAYINYAIVQAFGTGDIGNTILLDLPQKIGEHSYRTEFIDDGFGSITLVVQALDDASLSFTRQLFNTGTTIEGSFASSGPKQVVIYDLASNTITITTA